MAYRLTKAAEDQLTDILLHSARHHGIEAAGRYNRLMITAMQAAGIDPMLPGSTAAPGLPDVRIYPLQIIRMRLPPGERVHRPRHILIYRLSADGTTEILGLAHDRMVVSRAAGRALRQAEQP